MVVFCSAYGCTEKFIKGGPYTFHSFPKDEYRRKIWESKLRRENFKATDASRICSKHFSEDCFNRKMFGGTWLNKDAVPTIFNFPPHLKIEDDESKAQKDRMNFPSDLKTNDDESKAQKERINFPSHLKTDDDESTAPTERMILKRENSYEGKSCFEMECLSKRKRRCYLGDFDESDMHYPKKAVQVLQIAKEQKMKQTRKFVSLRKKNRYLKKRVASLKEALKEIQKNKCITDASSNVLEVLSKCSAPFCRGNYDGSSKVALFGFPSDERLREKWLHAISRKDLNVTKNSKVCERHFKNDEVLRNTTIYIEKTGKTISVPMKRPKLKENAVPSIFPDCPSFMSSSSLCESPFQKQQEMKPNLGTEFQSYAETSIVIKQEPDESVDEPPRPIIEKVLSAEELLSSSIISSSFTSSSSTSNIPPVPENTLPIANPHSAHVYQTPASHVSNKPDHNRKINDATPDAYDATLDATQAKLCQCPQRSMPSEESNNLQLNPPSGTSKKSDGRSTSPTQNGEDAIREILQSVLDSSENNPLFGARSTERPGDLFDTFSDFIADKLRKMDSRNCAYTLRGILDAVFKAGQVQHDSEVESDISSSNDNPGSSNEE